MYACWCVVIVSTLLGLGVTVSSLQLLRDRIVSQSKKARMPKFSELWVYLSAMPLFGLTAVAAPSGIAPALGTLAGCRAGVGGVALRCR